MPLLLRCHATPYCFRVRGSILSLLSAIWCYPPPPPPTLLVSTARLPWLPAALLANWWVHEPGDKQFWRLGFDQPSRLRCWIYQGFFCLFVFLRIKLALWICMTKMSSKSEIFDKCPAWFIMMSVWAHALFCTCSVILAAVLCSWGSKSALGNISSVKCDFCNQCLSLN